MTLESGDQCSIPNDTCKPLTGGKKCSRLHKKCNLKCGCVRASNRSVHNAQRLVTPIVFNLIYLAGSLHAVAVFHLVE